jgi:K+-transporting ATPase, c chain
MAPLPPIAPAPPRLMRLFCSMKTWTAHLSAPSVQLQQETRGLLQMTSRALRLLVILTVLCGVVFPLLVFGIGQVLFPTQANGSLVTNRHGHVIGSSGHRVIAHRAAVHQPSLLPQASQRCRV